MQVDPKVDPAWLQLLKLKHDKLLSNVAFNFSLRPYSEGDEVGEVPASFQVHRVVDVGKDHLGDAHRCPPRAEQHFRVQEGGVGEVV